MNARTYFGPRAIASYTVRRAGHGHGSGSFSTSDRASAHWHAAHMKARGLDPEVIRTEVCPAPLCDGYERVTPMRRGVSRGPCAGHWHAIDTVEDFDPVIAREYPPHHSVRERKDLATHNGIPLAMLWPEDFHACYACPARIPVTEDSCDRCARRAAEEHDRYMSAPSDTGSPGGYL
jgi:hypothetical protein